MTATANTVPPLRLKLSAELTRLADDWPEPRLSVGQLIAALGDRGLIGLMLILAAANIIPNPPGTSAVLGLPLIYLSWQMMRGESPWLPKFLTNRSFGIGHFRAVIRRAMPYLQKLERLLRPRLFVVSSPTAMAFLGCVCLLLAAILVLPIPFGNLLPATAIALIAIGALERDGVWMIAGAAFGIFTAFFLTSAVLLALRGLFRLIQMGL
ncbi:MAG: exopolysaccharide biosynthesis protein [Loktanella sp.]|nr:exopolysaccharide biosynthesis protein [Loktanella sp.]